MSDLEEHFNNNEDINYKELPLYHTCDMDAARVIFNSKKISPSPCPKFLENILYLFLGKSSYKKNAEKTQSRYYPVSFCINPKIKINILRSYPLDSGAIKEGIYEPIIAKEKFEVVKEQYNLGNQIKTCYKFIFSFFEKLEYYIKSVPFKSYTDSALPPHLYETKEIYDIYTQAYGERDVRSATIEVQSNDVIDLNSHNVLTVFYPTVLQQYNNTDFLNENFMFEPLIYSEARLAACSKYYDYIYEESQNISIKYLDHCESN
ncbi:hypothetical protein [Flavobacterium sp.]|uniref:hypothetical protein n=1 Tax=Flavobacterium sp. TaxID=239 RepID=UPI00374D5C68